jgi:nucleotide-binding universal stress UspA family protein
MSRIVVGVDGSENSLEALRFALAEARLRGATVVAVHVPHLPMAPVVGAPAFVIGDLPDLVQAVEESASQIVADALAEVRDEAAGIDVETVVVRGGVAHELVQASAGADLLVVGSRGRGGFAGLLLGSVSQQCVHHARCPVVIVPGPEREGGS